MSAPGDVYEGSVGSRAAVTCQPGHGQSALSCGRAVAAQRIGEECHKPTFGWNRLMLCVVGIQPFAEANVAPLFRSGLPSSGDGVAHPDVVA